MTNITGVSIDRWCITPFATRTRRLKDASETFLINLDILILIFDIFFSSLGMYLLKTTRNFKRKYCLWLLYHLYLNDIIFAVTTQTLYAIKLFKPELPCIYDILWSFVTLTIANASLSLVVAVAIIRLISTKYSLHITTILSKIKSRIILFLAYFIGFSINILMTVGAIINDVYLIHLPAVLTDILFPIAIPLIYLRAVQISRKRRESSYFKSQRSLVEAALRRGMYATILTYLPVRLPYFISSTYKMVYTIEFENDSNYALQLVHSSCFLIFCLTPVGNVVLYFMSDRRARRRIVAYLTYYKRYINQRFRRYVNRRSVGHIVI